MCYDIIPHELNHFDYETFRHCATRFHVVITNCRTGNADYPLIQDLAQPVPMQEGKPEGTELDYVRASGSLPLVSLRMAEQSALSGRRHERCASPHGGGSLMPPQKCCRLHPAYGLPQGRFAAAAVFPSPLPGLPCPYKKIRDRHERYNQSLDQLRTAEASGDAFVIQPPFALQTRLVEKRRNSWNRATRSITTRPPAATPRLSVI